MTRLGKESAGYSATQKILHWAVVALLVVNEFVVDGMGRLFRAHRDGTGGDYTATSLVHIAVGVAVLLLALWRLSLRFTRGAPPPPAGERPVFARIAGWTHAALYLLMLVIPLAGLAAWFGRVHELGDVHAFLASLLLYVAGLHVLGALVHQFVWKTNLIARMT